MADVTNEIMTNDKTKILSGEFLNFYTPRRQRIRSFKVYFSPKQEGSGTPSPDNVRPISGWTGVEVGHCGKNLFGGELYNGQIMQDGKFIGFNHRLTNVISTLDNENSIFLKSGTYTLSSDELDYCSLLTKNESGNILDNYATSWHNLPFTFTLTMDGHVYFTLRKSNNSAINPNDYNVQLELGSTPTEYTPYKTNLLLPPTLQHVEYLESTGTQYIDTGLYMDNNSAVRATVQLKRYGDNEFYYGAAGANYTVNSFELYRWIGNLQFNIVNTYNIPTSSIGDPGIIIKTEQSINECKVTYEDKTIVKQVTTLDFLSPSTLTLFALHRNSDVLYGKSRIYQLEIFQDNSLIRNFIPCYRKSDKVAGMYDTVSETFYTNSGSGEFITGPAVNRYDIDWSEDVGTVYGGYVDLVSGELVENITSFKIDYNTQIRYSAFTSSGVFGVQYNLQLAGANENLLMWSHGTARARTTASSTYPTKNMATLLPWNTETTYISIGAPDEITSIDEWNAWLVENEPLQVVYKLATPITHQLSPTTLSTLMFDNNFWSNADRIEIEYDYIGIFDPIESRKNIFTATPHTVTAKDSIVSFGTDMAADLKECKVWFLPKQEGEGDPSPENVRPIEGWDEIIISSSNEVLNIPEWEVGAISADVNNVKHDYNSYKTNNSTRVRCKYLYNLDINKTYRVIWNTNDYELVTQPYDSNGYAYKPSSPHNIWQTTAYEFSGVANVAIAIRKKDLGNVTINDAELADIKIVSYSSINITFPQTIYGGYVDLIKGEVVETEYYYNFANETPTWSSGLSNPNNQYFTPLPYMISGYLSNDNRTLCNKLNKVTNNNQGAGVRFGANNAVVYFYNMSELDEIEAAIDVRNYLKNNDVAIVYPLTTPNTYPIDPHILTTLRGANTIWSNSNSDVEITYWKHNDDSYQHVPSSPITSNDNFIIVTDDGYAIGEEDDFIVY